MGLIAVRPQYLDQSRVQSEACRYSIRQLRCNGVQVKTARPSHSLNDLENITSPGLRPLICKVGIIPILPHRVAVKVMCHVLGSEQVSTILFPHTAPGL